MKYVLFISALLFAWGAVGQNNYRFQLLPVTDTVRTAAAINKIDFKTKINASFFLTEAYDEKEGLFLFEQKGKDWIVYDYNEFVSNYSVSGLRYLDADHPAVTVTVSRSGMGTNLYNWIVIFDLAKKTYLSLMTGSYNEAYENSTATIEQCESKISIRSHGISVRRTCDAPPTNAYCKNCLSSGEYTIKSNLLTKLPTIRKSAKAQK